MPIEEYLDWLNSIEKFFDFTDVPDEKRVEVVAYKLRGVASS